MRLTAQHYIQLFVVFEKEFHHVRALFRKGRVGVMPADLSPDPGYPLLRDTDHAAGGLHKDNLSNTFQKTSLYESPRPEAVLVVVRREGKEDIAGKLAAAGEYLRREDHRSRPALVDGSPAEDIAAGKIRAVGIMLPAQSALQPDRIEVTHQQDRRTLRPSLDMQQESAPVCPVRYHTRGYPFVAADQGEDIFYGVGLVALRLMGPYAYQLLQYIERPRLVYLPVFYLAYVSHRLSAPQRI